MSAAAGRGARGAEGAASVARAVGRPRIAESTYEEWARLRLARALASSRRVARTVEQIRTLAPEFTERPFTWERALALLERVGLRMRRCRRNHDGHLDDRVHV